MNEEKFFAVSAPGLETFTAQELTTLGMRKPVRTAGDRGEVDSRLRIAISTKSKTREQSENRRDEDAGGVEFTGNIEMIYRANLYLRTASRVLVRLGDFYAAAFSELRKKASRLSWESFLKPGQAMQVRVTCHKSRLYHSDAVAERIAGAVGDRLGKAPLLLKPEGHQDEGENIPAQLVVVRLIHDQCTISIDSSGELLHRRGYRLATAKAPLRETLAAGMLLASGWDGRAPLLDPFCGSGTIAVEAALLARGVAPGHRRRFAFMEWPGFNRQTWNRLLEENEQQVQERMRLANQPWIAASDRDAGAIELARANAQRAGVEDAIEFSCRAVSAIEPQGVGWVVTNPPYGLRVSANKDLRNLYAQLGKVLKAKCPGWRLVILCSEMQLLGQIGLPLDTSLALVNGGVPVRLARGQV